MSKSIKVTKKSNKKRIKKSSKNSELANSKPDFNIKIREIREALHENYIQQKKLMAELGTLLTIHKQELKAASKTKRRNNSGKKSGITKPAPVPKSLCTLLKIKDDQELSRSDVSKLLYKYFTKHKMYGETRREIIPNAKLRKVFGMSKSDILTFRNIQTWLKKVYDEAGTNNTTLEIDD